jgi:Tol biopolymer transport system component
MERHDMKRIDASREGIVGLSWSSDNRWIAYVRGGDLVCLTDATTGEIREVGKGASPSITPVSSVLMERDGQIVEVTAGGERALVGPADLVKDTPKRAPLLGPDGTSFLFVVNNMFDKSSQAKNAYPYRNFLALGDLRRGAVALTAEPWYGGTAAWFPDGKRFAHYEFDSTGGARIHVVDADGAHQGSAFGLYPSPSPDGKRLACRPRGGGTVVVYTARGDSWDKDAVETIVLKIPSGDGRPSANPPEWLDNRYLLVDEGGAVWRLDTRKDDPEEMKKLPAPTVRGARTMALSPSREVVAIETPVDDAFELRVCQVR